MQPETESPSKERLQKILARAGFGSRRACEELIVDGRVSINGETISVLGATADVSRDTISVDGERISLPRNSYWIANKPEGVAVSERDAERFIENTIPGDHPRVFTVGRLDKGSCGLMFITNDGRVANILTHPRYKVPKAYRVTVKGELSFAAAAQIERALYYSMNGGRFERLRILKTSSNRSLVRLTAYEGLPGALRDICLKFDHPLMLIERTRIGPLELRELPEGASRKLHKHEIDALIEYCKKAEAFEIDYERELVSPQKFGRDAHAPEFHNKKQGARSSVGGQKAVARRVQAKKRFRPR
jgi:23S rRNA pseudouridine2605 synthase